MVHSRVLSILAAQGLVLGPPERGVPWLQVEQVGQGDPAGAAGGSLWLFRADEATDVPPRGMLGSLLRVALLRVAAEERGRSVQERLDLLSAASFEGILVHADGVVITANRRFAEMMGYGRDEILGQNTTRRFVAPEDLPGVLARMKGGHEGAYVITGVRHDGTRFRAELQSKQGQLGDRPVRVVAVRDVTERERTTELLFESEGRLRDLAEGAFDGILYNRNGTVVEVAGPIRERLGLEPRDLRSRPVMELVAPSSRALVARANEEGRTGSWEIEIVGPGGEPIPVEVVVVSSTLRGESVRVVGLRDLREKRRLESDDGQSALATLAHRPFDLIVLDMTMPDLDGGEIVRRVRAAGSKVPILLSSGYMAASADGAVDLSMIQGFLPKPFGPQQLMAAVDRALSGWGLPSAD